MFGVQEGKEALNIKLVSSSLDGLTCKLQAECFFLNFHTSFPHFFLVVVIRFVRKNVGDLKILTYPILFFLLALIKEWPSC